MKPIGDELTAAIQVSRSENEFNMIRRTQGDDAVYDLGSANGTSVDGVKLSGRTLRDRDTIELGATILEFGEA